jgi:hypothetical protein
MEHLLGFSGLRCHGPAPFFRALLSPLGAPSGPLGVGRSPGAQSALKADPHVLARIPGEHRRHPPGFAESRLLIPGGKGTCPTRKSIAGKCGNIYRRKDGARIAIKPAAKRYDILDPAAGDPGGRGSWGVRLSPGPPLPRIPADAEGFTALPAAAGRGCGIAPAHDLPGAAAGRAALPGPPEQCRYLHPPRRRRW